MFDGAKLGYLDEICVRDADGNDDGNDDGLAERISFEVVLVGYRVVEVVDVVDVVERHDGECVGDGVGDEDGVSVVGFSVGTNVGDIDGLDVIGEDVGCILGDKVAIVGDMVGEEVLTNGDGTVFGQYPPIHSNELA